MSPVDDGPDLPRTLAEAYATDLAAKTGTVGWNLIGSCLGRIESVREE
jgi:hypothetical protein